MSSHTYMYNVGVISYKLNFGKKQWLVVWSHVPSPLFFSLPPVSLRTWVESSHQTTFPQMQMFWESEWGPVESLRHSFKLIKLCFGKTQSPNTTVQRLNNCTCNTFPFFIYLFFIQYFIFWNSALEWTTDCLKKYEKKIWITFKIYCLPLNLPCAQWILKLFYLTILSRDGWTLCMFA